MDTKGQIAWCVPEPLQGGGGFRTITQNAKALQKAGYVCDFYIYLNDAVSIELNELKENIKIWFDFECSDIYFAYKLEKQYDLLIATSWNTVSFVADQDRATKKAYFVQDYEPWFFAMGAERLEAENTYSAGLIPITIGHWLSNSIVSDNQYSSFSTDFGADLSIYFDKSASRERAVCALYQPEKSRRAGSLVKEAVELLLDFDKELDIYIYGSNEQLSLESVRVHNLGLLSPIELNDLYNKCQCGICVSSSNPSRIPFEMMASGLVPIDLYKENNLYDFQNDTAVLVNSNAGAYVTAILELLNNEEALLNRSAKSKKFMANRDLAVEGRQFVEAVEQIFAGEAFSAICRNEKTYTTEPVNESLDIAECRRQHRIELRKEAFKAQIALNGTSFALTYRFINALSEKSKYKIAIWSQADQSDIKWIEGCFSKNAIRFMIPIPEFHEISRMYQIHLYEFREGELPIFIGAVSQKISYKEIDKGESRISNCDFAECEISSLTENISIENSKNQKKSLFNRFARR